MSSYTLYYDDERHGNWNWEKDIFRSLGEYLQTQGVLLTIQSTDIFVTHPIFFFERTIEVDHTMAIIQNNLTRSYIAFDCHDFDRPVEPRLKFLAFDPRCKIILKCQYRRWPYWYFSYSKIKPWTYFGCKPRQSQALIDDLRPSERLIPQMYFRGYASRSNRGPILESLAAKEIVNSDYEEFVEYEGYLQEISQHKVALALPGMGNICHREIEAFGVGTAVLMPKLKNRLVDDLICDYHYIGVDVDTLVDPPDYVADKIAERFQQVIHDEAYLDFISANALQWYDTNARVPNCFNNISEYLNIFTNQVAQ